MPPSVGSDRALLPKLCGGELLLDSLSVVFPAFNEQWNVRRTVELARKALPRVARVWEIIVVNDGSKDATEAVCDVMAAQFRDVRAIHHAANRGYGAALKSGIQEARYEWIFFSDADGQFDLQDLCKLLRHVDDSDIVAGYRKVRRDPFYRSLNAWGWNILVRATLGVRIRDIDCAFKLFRRGVFERIQIRSVGAMVNTEILAQSQLFGFRISEVEVTHHPRTAGNPTGARLGVIVKAFRELFRLWSMLRRIHHEEGLLAPRSAAGPAPAADESQS